VLIGPYSPGRISRACIGRHADADPSRRRVKLFSTVVTDMGERGTTQTRLPRTPCADTTPAPDRHLVAPTANEGADRRAQRS
jgi:hypothetical protein